MATLIDCRHPKIAEKNSERDPNLFTDYLGFIFT